VNFYPQLSVILKLPPLVTSEHINSFNSFTPGYFDDYFWCVCYKLKENLHFGEGFRWWNFSWNAEKRIHVIVSGQPSAFCFLEVRKILLSAVRGGATPASKCCTVLAFVFSFMEFHECLRFPVFSQVLITKQQREQLWVVSELDVMRVVWFGFGFWGFF